MSDNIKIEWDFSSITKGFEEMGEQIEKEAEEKATKRMAEVVKKKMEENVNVSKISSKDYTHIKDDIKISAIKVDKETTDRYREVAPSKKTNWRAVFLEYGTSTQSPRPFMQPALEASEREMEEIAFEEVKKVVLKNEYK